MCVFLRSIVLEIEKEKERERKLSYLLVHSPVGAKMRAAPVLIWEPIVSSRSLMWVYESKALGHAMLISQAISMNRGEPQD